MRVLLDTNVVLDYLGANQGFTDDAEKVFELAEKRNDIKFVSSSAVTDIIYVLKRAVKDMDIVRQKYKGFRSRISILSVTEQDIDTAFHNPSFTDSGLLKNSELDSSTESCSIPHTSHSLQIKQPDSKSPSGCNLVI